MAKKRKNISKRVKRYLRDNGSKIFRIALVIGVLVVALYFAVWFDNEGDRGGSYSASGAGPVVSSAEQYELALGLLENGKTQEARDKMQVIAPLGESSINKRGHAPAHLWLARDLLGGFNASFLNGLPVNYLKEGKSDLPANYVSNDRSKKAIKHLEHAIAIDNKMPDSSMLLAGLYLLENRRSDAVDVLVAAIGNEENPQAELLIPLAVVMTYEGDELEIEENALLGIDRVRRELSIRSRNKLSSQLTYLAHALVIKNFDVVNLVARRLAVSAGSRDDGGRVASQVGSAVDFWKALFLEQSPSESAASPNHVVKYLVESYSKDRSSPVLTRALQDLLGAYPEVKPEMKELLEKMPSSTDGESGSVPSEFFMLLDKLGAGAELPRKDYLEKAIKSDPQNLSAYFALIEYHLTQNEPDYGKARSLVDEINSDPAMLRLLEPDHFRIVGKLYIHEGKWEEAVMALEKALATTGNKKEIHELLSIAYGKLGKQDISQMHSSLATQTQAK